MSAIAMRKVGRIVAVAVAGVLACTLLAGAGTAEAKTVKKPAKVGKPSMSAVNATGFTVKWKKAKRAKGYQVKVYKGSKAVKTYKLKGMSKAVAGLSASTTYKVKVRAYNKSGKKVKYGKWSTVKSVKTAKKVASTKPLDLRWTYSVTGAYVEHHAATEYESEKSYLVLKIRVTNESDFSRSASLANLFELYQSGLEIDWAYNTCVEGTELSTPKMLPGVSYEGWTAWELRDTSSPVTLYECWTSIGYKNLGQSSWDVSKLEVKEA